MQAESHGSHPYACHWATLELGRKDVLALLRLQWRHRGRVKHVEEVCVYDTPEGYQIVAMALQRCATQGIDLMVLSERDPENFCAC